MGDTYDRAEQAAADREQQQSLLTALNAWDRALRKDECNAWVIAGKNGTVHTWGDGHTWIVRVRCRSEKHWAYTKRRLVFCTVTQDGDNEGCLRLHQLPTADQAEVIRDILCIRKRVELSAATLETLRARIAGWNAPGPQLKAEETV